MRNQLECRLFLIANTAFAPSRGRFPSRTRLFAIKASLLSRSAGPIPKTIFQADGCVIRESQGNLGIRKCRVPWAVGILNREVPSTQASLHLPTNAFIHYLTAQQNVAVWSIYLIPKTRNETLDLPHSHSTRTCASI